jgi:hypothetical protein
MDRGACPGRWDGTCTPRRSARSLLRAVSGGPREQLDEPHKGAGPALATEEWMNSVSRLFGQEKSVERVYRAEAAGSGRRAAGESRGQAWPP